MNNEIENEIMRAFKLCTVCVDGGGEMDGGRVVAETGGGRWS